MNPKHYVLHLEPDLSSFTVEGKVVIEIVVDVPTTEIALDANALDVHQCTVEQEGKVWPCDFAVYPQRQQLVVNLPKAMAGTLKITVEYRGEINDDLVGMYRSRYILNGETRYLAVTQFEERDARRVLPCFDHPAKKATFDVEFLIDESLMGVANTPIAEEIPQGNGKKLVRFERTPPMSTYLLFFGVGDFEVIEERGERWTVRVLTTPGKTQYGRFALQMGQNALRFGEMYTGIPFPLAKCDHIAVPDFAFGAMENYGAITYRENALLVYPGVTSMRELAQIASVIAHETAHMWFGNLVSPADWKYVWLNESFATYFTYAITDHYYPEWQIWDLFISQSLLEGMWRDALPSTPPIELPDGEAAAIDISSAPIIYSKGASIIRMLTAYLGEAQLRKGLHHFLEKYKFSAATTQQYWEAFEEATGEPVSAFAASWIHQPGYPLIETHREGKELHLQQRRFVVGGETSVQQWVVPIEMVFYHRDGRISTRQVTMRSPTATFSLPGDVVAYKLNHEQRGFYRVQYEPEMWDELGRRVALRELSATDSFGVQNDLFALACAGRVKVANYLDFLASYFVGETRHLPLFDIARNLRLLYVLREEEREAIAALGLKIVRPVLNLIGMEPQPDDGLHVSDLRDRLLWTAFLFGDEEVADFGRVRFQALMEGDKVPPDILRSVLRIGAVVFGHPPDSSRALEYMVRRLMGEVTSESEKIAILEALGCSPDESVLRAVLELNLQSVPKKNRAYMLGSAAYNPVAVTFLWRWLTEHFEELRLLHPIHVGRILVSVIPTAGLGHEEEVIRFLHTFGEHFPAARATVAMTLELLAMHNTLRRA